jgi:putative membrane protein
LKVATYIGGALGIALLIVLILHADVFAMVQTLRTAGWDLLWILPYRAIYFLLYAAGWFVLLRPNDPGGRAGFGYLFWVTGVREAVDRLLPVASVGGSVVGIRLVRWRKIATAAVSASVIIEIVLTLVVSYIFTAIGLFLLVDVGSAREYRHLVIAFLLSLPIPLVTLALLRYGSVFGRLHKLVRPLVGSTLSSEAAESLDRELRASLQRQWRLLFAGATQLLALIAGSFEIWFALRLFGHPVDAGAAIALESMTLAVRHLAFVVPAGLGVQEAGLVLFGHALGINSELALAVSMAKRLRELAWGLPCLISWQWQEGRRLQFLREPRTN